MDIFAVGIAGAFCVYFVTYRESRIRQVIEHPKENWRVVAFDIVFFLVCGGLVAYFYSNATDVKEAFAAGAGWQGLIGGAVVGNELNIQKRTRERMNHDRDS